MNNWKTAEEFTISCLGNWKIVEELVITALEELIPAVLAQISLEYWIPLNWYTYDDYEQVSTDPSFCALYQKLALQHSSFGQIRLAHCYQRGLGVQQNHNEALRLYKLAAKTGDVEGEQWVAYYLWRGPGPIIKDDKEAFRLSQLGVSKGHIFAYYNLGVCYQDGRGVDKNLLEAIRLFQIGVEYNDSWSQNSLGFCYGEGLGVEQSWEQGAHYYSLSAAQGNAVGQKNLGVCYSLGNGVSADVDIAFHYFTLSAQRGNASGQYNLATSYDLGEGVEKDFKKAFEYYYLSHQQGYLPATYNLATKYENGEGVKKNIKEALRLYRICAAQGDKDAQAHVQRLDKPVRKKRGSWS